MYVEIELRFKAIRRFKIQRNTQVDLPHPLRFQRRYTEVSAGCVIPVGLVDDFRTILDSIDVVDCVAGNRALWDKLKASAVSLYENVTEPCKDAGRRQFKNTVGLVKIITITEPYYQAERERIAGNYYER